MFGIGRLNGNNLRFGSIDLTTSQLYTGMLSLILVLTSRFVCYKCAASLLSKSGLNWYPNFPSTSNIQSSGLLEPAVSLSAVMQVYLRLTGTPLKLLKAPFNNL